MPRYRYIVTCTGGTCDRLNCPNVCRQCGLHNAHTFRCDYWDGESKGFANKPEDEDY